MNEQDQAKKVLKIIAIVNASIAAILLIVAVVLFATKPTLQMSEMIAGVVLLTVTVVCGAVAVGCFLLVFFKNSSSNSSNAITNNNPDCGSEKIDCNENKNYKDKSSNQ